MTRLRRDLDNKIGKCPRCDQNARFMSFERCDSCDAVICFRCFSVSDHVCFACLFRNRAMRENVRMALRRKLVGIVRQPEKEGHKFRSVLVHEDILNTLINMGLAVIL